MTNLESQKKSSRYSKEHRRRLLLNNDICNINDFVFYNCF